MNRVQKTACAGLIGLAVSFNNPAGHEMAYEAGMRIYYAHAWVAAARLSGRPISFSEFRENAAIYQAVYHNSDFDKVLADIKLLGSRSPFCITLPGEEESGNGNDNPPQNPVNAACHVAFDNRKKKVDKGPSLS